MKIPFVVKEVRYQNNSYYWNNIKIKNRVTGLISKAGTKFDPVKIATYISKKETLGDEYNYIKETLKKKNPSFTQKDFVREILNYWKDLKQIGDDVHKMMDDYNSDCIVDLGNFSNHFQSISQFYYDMEMEGYTIYASEWVIINPEFESKYFNGIKGIGGTIDAVLHNQMTNKFILVDLKTTSSAKSFKILKWMQQLGLYNSILEFYKKRFSELSNYYCEKCIVLQIHPKNGKSIIHTFETEECMDAIKRLIK